MINILKDELFSHDGTNYKIKRVMSDRIHVVGENLQTRETKLIPITSIRKPVVPDVAELFPMIPADLLTQQEEKVALRRVEIIKPFIDKYGNPDNGPFNGGYLAKRTA